MEKDCQYLSWENAPIGPLLGHAAHLARERMDVRLARYDVSTEKMISPSQSCIWESSLDRRPSGTL